MNKIEIIKPDHNHDQTKTVKKKRNKLLSFILITGEFLVWITKGIMKVLGTVGKGLANTDLMTGQKVNNNQNNKKQNNNNNQAPQHQQHSMFGNIGVGSIIGKSQYNVMGSQSSEHAEPKKKKPKIKKRVTEYYED